MSAKIKLAMALPKFLMVNQLLQLHSSGLLNLHPFFQRRAIWPERMKAALIESILEGFPVPEIFIHVNHETKTYDVIDGQQRLIAITEFADGKLVAATSTFGTLGPNDKKFFLEYPIAIREVPQVGIATVREIFRRLNTNVVVLTAQELRHAEYSNGFTKLVEELAADPYWLSAVV
ncbi:MAG: DUF262 domain-containing protein [Thaumarchaeota archaeon]|nr:DUF262 domain-containing protein [Nitrososphaerota archaeon]